MDMDRIMNGLIEDEGFGKPGKPGRAYKDAQGVLTVGVGRNLEFTGIRFGELARLLDESMSAAQLCHRLQLAPFRGWWVQRNTIFFRSEELFHDIIRKDALSTADSRFLLEADVQEAVHAAVVVFGNQDWHDMPAPAKEVVVQVIFNLGLHGFSHFKKTIAALRHHDWETAAAELLDSRAARQTGQRYVRYADALRALSLDG